MKYYMFLFISFFLVNATLFPHGVNYKKINGGIGIEVLYDNGKPISEAETKIYSPREKNNTFQEGYTDKNGRFLFYPDEQGKWKIIISDGMGHGVSTFIEINNIKTMEIGKTGNIPIPLYNKILLGISIIFGITGILTFLATRKIRKE